MTIWPPQNVMQTRRGEWIKYGTSLVAAIAYCPSTGEIKKFYYDRKLLANAEELKAYSKAYREREEFISKKNAKLAGKVLTAA